MRHATPLAASRSSCCLEWLRRTIRPGPGKPALMRSLTNPIFVRARSPRPCGRCSRIAHWKVRWRPDEDPGCRRQSRPSRSGHQTAGAGGLRSRPGRRWRRSDHTFLRATAGPRPARCLDAQAHRIRGLPAHQRRRFICAYPCAHSDGTGLGRGPLLGRSVRRRWLSDQGHAWRRSACMRSGLRLLPGRSRS